MYESHAAEVICLVSFMSVIHSFIAVLLLLCCQFTKLNKKELYYALLIDMLCVKKILYDIS